MAITYGLFGLYGLSTDTKPTNVVTNSLFWETDTDTLYRWNGTTWNLLSTSGNVGVSLSFNNQALCKFGDADNSNFAILKAPTTIPADYTVTLPTSDGKKNYILKTDGAGALTFENTFAGKAINPLTLNARASLGSSIGGGSATSSDNTIGIQITTGATSGNDARAYRDIIGAPYNKPFVLFGHVRTGSDPSGTVTEEWGTYDGTNIALNTVQDTVSFKCIFGTDTNWICRSGDGTTQQTTDSGIAYANNTNYRFMIISDGSSVRFYINGVWKATHNTNIPNSGTQYPSFYVRTDDATTASMQGEITMVMDE